MGLWGALAYKDKLFEKTRFEQAMVELKERAKGNWFTGPMDSGNGRERSMPWSGSMR